ncbi:hypothetical protein ABQZ99_007230 [Xanthomonas hortorum pv. vitians]|uniref:Uncharacterized protein n=1 Tax=Xanthomonas hortorum pv. vitians TaxID=83224 RepID=A0A6V7EVD7_9XANT|nr:hypothetical protein [Xanthomonas hortorum]APP85528.1 hypothetical protein BI317_16445 [Xanthomonas hortorum pv. gardneri]ASW44611.1 hypothetical protein XJ27_00490 [Xanthomonas hortorum]MCC8495325.1 hypothetical protein [Xanthomonas hortorum pv. gardneri]MCE4282970.1 hypothetical protein [Xanthomonas hortorum pv. vitians]MCE4285592.1 hypothetical protein [Xanthomonas hortorum pv. vitians]
MLAHAQVHRRAQRLLPAGIDTVALLPAAPLQRWECSPLSALPLGREGRGGVIGLRLHAATAQALRTGGTGFLQAAQQHKAPPGTAPTRSYAPWQRLNNGSYWTRSTDALLGVLLAADEAAVWLSWQQPDAAGPGNGRWLR